MASSTSPADAAFIIHRDEFRALLGADFRRLVLIETSAQVRMRRLRLGLCREGDEAASEAGLVDTVVGGPAQYPSPLAPDEDLELLEGEVSAQEWVEGTAHGGLAPAIGAACVRRRGGH